ncbi:glycosyl-4,4'-diaponeurosporenoate acyltransferase CrtO family protein [Chitinimonas naiadis]
MTLLNNAIAVMFLSFIIGALADLVLRRMPFYGWMSARYLFADSKTYESLGVEWFRKILLATPLRIFNTNIKLPKHRDLQLLKEIRKHIATAEVSHWVGFAVMMVLTIYAWGAYGPKTGLSFVFFNTIGNLYPCLLQQYNKRRLYQLIAAMERRKR